MVQTFKGIALFTPGGDLVYCIDPNKKGRWHLHLCVSLQEKLSLSEPPHFLVPGYTATIDRDLDPKTGQLLTWAEVYPPVQRYQVLLNAIFGTVGLVWQTSPWQEESCNPIVIETYRHQFPQLWEEHDLIFRLEANENQDLGLTQAIPSSSLLIPQTTSYVLRLFVSGHSWSTQKALESLHQLLEEGLNYPYTLKVIDIVKHPEEAEQYNVSATPTLVRINPKPIRKVVGSFDDMPRILQIIAAI